ncbi:FG-GAP-like repeat-containing protein [Patescibacteria group bacterium]
MPKVFFVSTICIVLMLGLFIAAGASAADTMPVEVKVWNWNTSEEESSYLAFPETNHNGGDVAVGDFDKDGYGEIAIAAGKNSGPHVRMFSKAGAAEKIDFFPFKQDFRGGLTIDGGDIDGDGREDLAVAPRSGGQARVRVYKTNEDREIIVEFLAFPESFQGGANLALGDYDGDGKDEIAVAPGTAGAPLIKFFEADGTSMNKDFYAFGEKEKGGANIAAADFDGDGIDELIVGRGPFGGTPYVKTYRVDQAKETIIASWKAYDEGFWGGVKVGAADLDQDGRDEVVTAPGWGGGPHIKGWTSQGKLHKLNNLVYASDFRGSFNFDAGDIDRDGKTEIVTVPDKKPGTGRLDFFRYIDVSLGEQRLRAFENGEEVKTYLVSTGTSEFPTPTGTFSVRSHIAKTRMSWEYGPDDPNNYDLPDVPHVLPFDGPYTIHGAYWHNNFGHRMSHGCVNEPLTEAGWLYNWARNGDVVWVH